MISNKNFNNHFLAGNFNFDLLKDNDHSTDPFLGHFLERECIPNFSTITRSNDHGGGSCIDNFFSKTNLKTNAHKLLFKITDHYPLFLHINFENTDYLETTQFKVVPASSLLKN